VDQTSHRTRADIDCAILSLTDAQWVRLRKIAGLHALGRPIEAEDLLQEAFRRALDGERKCPTTVDMVRFLAEAMRSIADSEVKRARRRPRSVPLPDYNDPRAEAAEPSDPVPVAEEILQAAEKALEDRRKIVDLFGDDPATQVIVEGIMEGHRGDDLRALTDLDPTAYQSKRKAILRRIAKYQASKS
jgi:RNA polymerase sporulation-specific sigma factor